METNNQESPPSGYFASEERREELKNLLKYPSDERRGEILDRLEDLAMDIKFLEQFRGSPKLKELCKHIRFQSFGARITIFEQEDEGDAFYVIYSGSINVYIRVVGEYTGQVYLKPIAELHEGDSFGELALIYGARRSATVVTSEPTDLIVLEKEVYDRVVKGFQTNQIDSIIAYFSSIPVFKNLTMPCMVSLATKAVLKKYSTNNVVIRQGEEANNFYFIRTGRFKVLRKVDFRRPSNHEHDTMEWLIGDPDRSDRAKGRVVTKLLEIDELGTGDFFAEASVLFRDSMHHSVIPSMPSEVFVLDKFDFKKVHPTLMEEFKGFSKPYPDDTQLRQSFIELERWESYKKNICDTVKQNSQISRASFSSHLRSPMFENTNMKDPFNFTDTPGVDHAIQAHFKQSLKKGSLSGGKHKRTASTTVKKKSKTRLPAH